MCCPGDLATAPWGLIGGACADFTGDLMNVDWAEVRPWGTSSSAQPLVHQRLVHSRWCTAAGQHLSNV